MFSLIHFLHPCFPLPSSLSHSPALPSPPPLHLCSPPASPHLLSPSILPASLPSSSPAAPIETQRNADAGISFSISLLSPLKFLLCPAPPAPPTQASPPLSLLHTKALIPSLTHTSPFLSCFLPSSAAAIFPSLSKTHRSIPAA